MIEAMMMGKSKPPYLDYNYTKLLATGINPNPQTAGYIEFNGDGTVCTMYSITDTASYNLSTAWDLSTAVLDTSNIVMGTDLNFVQVASHLSHPIIAKNNGYLLVYGSQLYYFDSNFSSALNINHGEFITYPSQVYSVFDSTNRHILLSPYDENYSFCFLNLNGDMTTDFTKSSLDMSLLDETDISGAIATCTDDGKTVYLSLRDNTAGNYTDYEIALSTAWDFSTASVTTRTADSGNDVQRGRIIFTDNGNKFYIPSSYGSFKQYSTSRPYSIMKADITYIGVTDNYINRETPTLFYAMSSFINNKWYVWDYGNGYANSIDLADTSLDSITFKDFDPNNIVTTGLSRSSMYDGVKDFMFNGDGSVLGFAEYASSYSSTCPVYTYDTGNAANDITDLTQIDTMDIKSILDNADIYGGDSAWYYVRQVVFHRISNNLIVYLYIKSAGVYQKASIELPLNSDGTFTGTSTIYNEGQPSEYLNGNYTNFYFLDSNTVAAFWNSDNIDIYRLDYDYDLTRSKTLIQQVPIGYLDGNNVQCTGFGLNSILIGTPNELLIPVTTYTQPLFIRIPYTINEGV